MAATQPDRMNELEGRFSQLEAQIQDSPNKEALSILPGNKSTLIALGKTPQTHPSQLVTDILTAIEQELTRQALPTAAFFALRDYLLARQHISPITSKVDWTL